jgi:hypothetical protein
LTELIRYIAITKIRIRPGMPMPIIVGASLYRDCTGP